MLRLTTEHLNRVKYPRLIRPKIGPTNPPTIELVHWGIQAYCLPWVRHFNALISGIISLTDSDNKAAVRIVGRALYELCAHGYYVKKHIKQHLQAKNLSAAWDFLLPIATGSRYIDEYHATGIKAFDELFPTPPHIRKAINCFREVTPRETEDDYSYLSEYSHPNMMTFRQHYRWTTPYVIDFVDEVHFGAFGAIAASSLQGLLAIEEFLGIGNEHQVRKAVGGLLEAIAKHAKAEGVT